MKIKEVSERTGLTKKTIRYYEAEGLLSPEKQWQNGREYRNYSEADIQRLTKIAALRRARFSVEEIRHIHEVPGDIPEIFQSYRRRLQQEQVDLSAILAVINNITSETLTSEDTLISQMKPATVGLPLPAVDLDPHFRYLDEMEELSQLVSHRITPQEQKQKDIAAMGAAMYAGFNQQDSTSGSNASPGGYGSGFDISPAQKVATYNLLLNTKDMDQ
ncbi:MAG: MerR family transcriptional regulator [Oscillospiraceae bacterium]|nr:MerR family transcriptional regulator [Oscillospiraceae bacterium]